MGFMPSSIFFTRSVALLPNSWSINSQTKRRMQKSLKLQRKECCQKCFTWKILLLLTANLYLTGCLSYKTLNIVKLQKNDFSVIYFHLKYIFLWRTCYISQVEFLKEEKLKRQFVLHKEHLSQQIYHKTPCVCCCTVDAA